MKDPVIAINPVSRRGKYLVWSAKVGTGPSDLVLIKRTRVFTVGKRIEFVKTRDLEGMSVGCAPQRWSLGRITEINEQTGMLFISFI